MAAVSCKRTFVVLTAFSETEQKLNEHAWTFFYRRMREPQRNTLVIVGAMHCRHFTSVVAGAKRELCVYLADRVCLSQTGYLFPVCLLY